MDELALRVREAQRGDPAAWEAIVSRLQDLAYGVAYAQLGDHHLAQDAAQEAFVEAFLHLEKLREPAAFPGWFRQVLVRQCIRLTRRKSFPLLPLEAALEVASDQLSPEAAAEQVELYQQVFAAVRSLPEHERVVTRLFYEEGYSHREIGEILDLPQSTVKKRLFSARRRLKDQMLPVENVPRGRRRLSSDRRFSEAVQLRSAVLAGCVERARRALERDPGLARSRDGAGRTVLHVAATHGAQSVIPVLMEFGADPQATDRAGRTALDCVPRGERESWSAVLGFQPGAGAVSQCCVREHEPRPRGGKETSMEGKPAIAAELVRDMVGNAHGDLDRVKQLLEQEPALANACWDWGGGDWETALGAAAHMGRKDIAGYLLARGARVDLFAAAMLGKLEIVKAVIEDDPGARNRPGPHGIPLMAHAERGGAEAAAVLDYLKSL